MRARVIRPLRDVQFSSEFAKPDGSRGEGDLGLLPDFRRDFVSARGPICTIAERKAKVAVSNWMAKPDYRLAVGYGSAWHLLRCLGWQRDRFNKQIAYELGATCITWLDFPDYIANQSYPSGMPIRDGEWKRIAFVDIDQVHQAYNKFWPSRGEQQNWDAIGKAVIDGREEWLLVEAKAHLGEINSNGTDASESSGRPMIRAAFKDTLGALGYDAGAASTWAERWLTGYYQHANRLATLHFFTQRGIAARLIFLYFCGDQHPDGKFCPSKPGEWRPTLAKIYESLGLKGASALGNRVHNIFVHVDLAGDRSSQMLR